MVLYFYLRDINKFFINKAYVNDKVLTYIGKDFLWESNVPSLKHFEINGRIESKC